jgi:DNA phosphorothioation system restriction enzyme
VSDQPDYSKLSPREINLARLELDFEYRTGEGDALNDFYIPCLQNSVLYRRAVGFFTSDSIQLAAQGIEALIANEGHMQLVASPRMAPEDIEAIRAGYKSREQVASDALQREIPEFPSEHATSWSCLAWMVQNRLLEIQILLPKQYAWALYHEKLGVFSDKNDNHVAFSGSANETAGGLMFNFEAIDVFRSWIHSEEPRVRRKLLNFQRLWSNQTDALTAIPFPEACARKLLVHVPRGTPRLNDRTERPSITLAEPKNFSVPASKKPRDYQLLAVDNWIKQNGRGVFHMATGSGKTFTSLVAAQRVFAALGLSALVVVCPYRHLVDQWADNVGAFGLKPILAYESRQLWLPAVNDALFRMRRAPADAAPVCIITTNSTFCGEVFQNKLSQLPSRCMLIADEVHNLGANGFFGKMPLNIQLRLGLSATPERWFDPVGTDFISKYFGPVVEPAFGIREALKCGALVPYNYYPILVPLTDDECEEYEKLSLAIARRAGGAEANEDDDLLKPLFLKRARLLASAKNKLVALGALMSTRKEQSHMLFYCGDGQTEDISDQEEKRQIEAVIRLLGSQLGIPVQSYTAETSIETRRRLSRQLDSGELKGLVAIRCLDEGVDIPSVKTAVILASSTNPRQFIQRRGRILRPSPETGKTHAEVYDMIVHPPLGHTVTEVERRLVRKELIRVTDFADLARNCGEARVALLPLQKQFNLLDL